MFGGFSAVDVNDHLRQGVCNLESYWVTRDWKVRIFTTIFSMCITNAFLAYKFELLPGAKVMPFLDFIDQVAYKLIFNEDLEGPRAYRQIAAPADKQQVKCYDVSRIIDLIHFNDPN